MSQRLIFSEIPPRQIETERLILRAVEESDVEAVFRTYASLPAATRYMSFPCAKTPEDSAAFIVPAAKFFRGEPSEVKDFVWLIHRKGTNSAELIGSTGFGARNDFTVVGGYILAPSAWGRGYATEAWRAVTEIAKGNPKVVRIEAQRHPANAASGRVMEKCGMQFEGTLRRHSIYPNISKEPVDTVIYSWVRI